MSSFKSFSNKKKKKMSLFYFEKKNWFNFFFKLFDIILSMKHNLTHCYLIPIEL